jgi:hypothetical protein
MPDNRPSNVPYNSYYHGNRWDSYNPPKDRCPRCGSRNVSTYSPPYSHSPYWLMLCNPCAHRHGRVTGSFKVST